MTGVGNPVLRHAMVGVPALLAAGAVSLPLSATFLDGDRFPDNMALYGAYGIGAAAGAGITALLPGMAGRNASRLRGAVVGAGYGAAATTAGLVGLALLLGG